MEDFLIKVDTEQFRQGVLQVVQENVLARIQSLSNEHSYGIDGKVKKMFKEKLIPKILKELEEQLDEQADVIAKSIAKKHIQQLIKKGSM